MLPSLRGSAANPRAWRSGSSPEILYPPPALAFILAISLFCQYGADELAGEIGVLNVGPVAGASNESDGFFATNWGGEGGAHVIVGFGERDSLILYDGVVEYGAVAALYGDNVAFG